MREWIFNGTDIAKIWQVLYKAGHVELAKRFTQMAATITRERDENGRLVATDHVVIQIRPNESEER